MSKQMPLRYRRIVLRRMGIVLSVQAFTMWALLGWSAAALFIYTGRL